MALTPLQRRVCRTLADRRREDGESYVAGGAALSEALGTARQSRDVDIFHDAPGAVAASWTLDRQCLARAGFQVTSTLERPTFIQARVEDGGEVVLVEWTADSAFRFFPLVEHDDLGLTLHPFDLATNKVLALVGRLEVRDWIDVLDAHRGIQALGLLAWAACGKDPGFNPSAILDAASRSGRYTDPEIALLAFQGPPPRAAELAGRWKHALEEARSWIALLPASRAGTCVLDARGHLLQGSPTAASEALADGHLQFHEGRLHGAWPQIRP